jgi:glutaminyl-tRNA synthetase
MRISSKQNLLKDSEGIITEIHVTYDDASRSGVGMKLRNKAGTLHWVSIKHAVEAEAFV